MLGLRIHTDGRRRRLTASLRRVGPQPVGSCHQLQDLIQRGDLELAIKPRVGRAQLRDALARPQTLELGEREVLGEPARDAHAIDFAGAAPEGKLRVRGDIGGAADLILVARHQHAITGAHQVRLDEVRALLDGEEIGGQSVLGDVAAGTAVTDDEGCARVAAGRGVGAATHGCLNHVRSSGQTEILTRAKPNS